MKLYLLRYVDVMTGYMGFVKVQAYSRENAIDMLMDENPDFEVLEG